MENRIVRGKIFKGPEIDYELGSSEEVKKKKNHVKDFGFPF